MEKLTSDLAFSHHSLRKDIKGFVSHAGELAKAIQLVDCGPRRTKNGTDKRSGNKDHGSLQSKQSNSENDRKTPLCLWEPDKAKACVIY